MHKIEDGPSTHVSISRDDALVYYRQMQTIRRMETAAGEVIEQYCAGTVNENVDMQAICTRRRPSEVSATFIQDRSVSLISHCCMFQTFHRHFHEFHQEACCVGMKASMRPHDAVITAYRAHGWTYMMGVDAVGVLAELTGRSSGCARGKGGSMHMYVENFYGGNGIVGAQCPLGAGVALSLKYKGCSLIYYYFMISNLSNVFVYSRFWCRH